MKNFIEWKINKALKSEGSEIYLENTISIRSENEEITFPGRKVYQVIDNDEDNQLITLQAQDDESKYIINQNELSKALAEDAGAHGFQALQYPVGALLTTSGTDLGKLSIYDKRLRKKKL